MRYAAWLGVSLFGIANQLLSVIALCLATTVILKIQLLPAGKKPAAVLTARQNGRPMFTLITLA